ncbi:mitochondrial distribution and morphology [Thecaphora frezii]
MAAFNPMAMLAERACAPIYNAIDTGNSALAIKHADKVLASQPNMSLASALKTIALIRTGKKAEASKICDELVKRDLTRSGDEAAIHPLTWSLSRLGRGSDEVALLEKACKAQPTNEDLARQAVFAMIKHKHYQKAQQTSLKMHKSFDSARKDRKLRWQYFWWSIQSYILLSRHKSEPGAALALPLCERMIDNHEKTQPLDENAEEELSLRLMVLLKQGKKADAFKLLSNPGSPGDKICQQSLSLEFQRRELAEELNEWPFVRDEARVKLEAGSRNWAHMVAFIRASAKNGASAMEQAKEFVDSLASSQTGSKDRSTRLAQLELERADPAASSAVESSARTSHLIASYFETFGTKPCCYEDLLPYLALLSSAEREELGSKLDGLRKQLPVKDEKDLRWNINIAKLQRSMLPKDQITLQNELETAAERLREYLQGLEIGKSLPDTEMQPADDLALLGSQSLVSAYSLSPEHSIGLLQQVVAVLEFACGKSKKGYQLRMLLIRCYLILGCFDRASIHYNLVGIKAIQNDTLSHLISDRASSFTACASPSAAEAKSAKSGPRPLVSKAIAAAEEIYSENQRSTPEMVVKCFEHGTFSRVEEFVDFGEAIDRSIQRQLLRVESARTKRLGLASSAVSESDRQRLNQEIAALMEAVKRDLTLACHDQRDFAILPNFQPLDTPSIMEQTALGPRTRSGYLKCMHQLIDATVTIEMSEDDHAELTGSEREMLDLVSRHRSGGDALLVDRFFEEQKTRVSALVASLQYGQARPFDLLHTISTTLETYALVFTSGSAKSSTRDFAKAQLAQMASVIDDAARTLPPDTPTAAQHDALASGFATLGKDRVVAMYSAAVGNTVKSFEKALDAARDALCSVA